MPRTDGRKPGELRKISIIRNYIPHAEGSVLLELGNTKVICTASIEQKVPMFLRGSEQGWITAEYAMIPRATANRTVREATHGKVGGRTHEIQRLIGRSLRSVTDLKALGERTVWIDCDVIQADGGTRTAAITGAYIALFDALQYLIKEGKFSEMPLSEFVAATSVGIVNSEPYLDLNFEEDVAAQVDMNIVMTDSGKIIEVQGTAEKRPFNRNELDELLNLAYRGIQQLTNTQKAVLQQDKKE